MDDFYRGLLHHLPPDRWGHPTLPMPERVGRKHYARQLLSLQIELVKMQAWARTSGERILLLFEGRDTAGKGGTIQRMREHLNPRYARHVALPAPNETEAGQWYFQRYVEQLPTKGEIAFFDRSWYNRAGVERVMGFASDAQVDRFFEQVVPFEQFLVDDGIHLVKLWLSVGREEQAERLERRRTDPLRQWKLSPLDHLGPSRWEQYTLAALDMFSAFGSSREPLVVRQQQQQACRPAQPDPASPQPVALRRQGRRRRGHAARRRGGPGASPAPDDRARLIPRRRDVRP